MNFLNLYDSYSSFVEIKFTYFLLLIVFVKITNSNEIIIIIEKLKPIIKDINY